MAHATPPLIRLTPLLVALGVLAALAALSACAGVAEEPEGPLCIGALCMEGRPCVEGERRCVENRPQICVADGQWGEPRPCDGVCVVGSCQVPCPDGACMPGSVRCAPEGLQTCERREDGCGAFGPPASCPPGQRCLDQACRDDCPTECVPGERRCGAAGVVDTCLVAEGCAAS